MIAMFLVLLTARLGASSPTSAPAINVWCPVLTEEKADPGITTAYRGRTIAFCCDRCLQKFKRDPDRFAALLPQLTGAAGAGLDVPRHTQYDEHSSATQSSERAMPESGHAHQHSQGNGDSGEAPEPFLGRIHPAIVHFPIAGIPLALLGFLAWLVTGRDSFAKADLGPLLVGTLAAVVAVITGNIAHNSMRFSESLHVVVERHRTVATTTMVLALCLSVLRICCWNRRPGPWRWVYGAGLLIAVVLVAVTGYLGGSVVFGPDHLKL